MSWQANSLSILKETGLSIFPRNPLTVLHRLLHDELGCFKTEQLQRATVRFRSHTVTI